MKFDSSSLGYILDFIAGVFIVSSIIFRSKRDIKVEAETLYDGNPFVYESQLKASFNGWVGVLLLFIGTMLHLYDFGIKQECFILILFTTLILLTIITFIIRATTERWVKTRYPHYDSVKKAKEEGKYDQYP